MRCQTNDVKSKVPKVASDDQTSPNVTMHLDQKHVFFQVERSREVLKTFFLVTVKAESRAQLKKNFLNRPQRRFGKIVFRSKN